MRLLLNLGRSNDVASPSDLAYHRAYPKFYNSLLTE